MLLCAFSGSGLAAVDAAGRLVLPGFVRETLNRRHSADSLIIGSHEVDPCLVAYDPAFATTIHADVERRRLAEEAIAPHLHHMRARRAFGFVEQVRLDGEAVTLPPIMRRRARIGKLALLVGAGGTFEIWDAEAALEGSDADLRDLAAFHVDSRIAA
jgi:MraZ protein